MRDAPYFDEMVVKGHRPILALEIAIDTIFFHGAKAFMRSRLWQPETWHPDDLPSNACLVKEVSPAITESLEDLEKYYGPENYERGLYQSIGWPRSTMDSLPRRRDRVGQAGQARDP
jgi:uncharacterized protein